MTRTPSNAASAPRPSRVQSALFVLGALLLIATFWWTGQRMILRWEKTGGYYSHGWLVPAVSVVLLWLKRKRIAACPRAPSAWGLLLLIPSLLVHLAGAALDLGFVSGFALIGVLAGLTLTLFGRALFAVTLFPLLFLTFMVPVPEVLIEKISFNMKLMAAAVAAGITDLLGLVAVRAGSIIHLPPNDYIPHYQRLIVDDICSGLKYLISLTAFGALYAHLSQLRYWCKATLFALSIPISFVANVFRVILMVLVAYRWGTDQVGEWYFHDLFGILLFVFAFCFLFLVESLLMKFLGVKRENLGSAPQPPEPSAGPDHPPQPPPFPTRPGPVLAAFLLSMLCVSAALSAFFVRPRKAPPVSGILDRVPRVIGSWRGMESHASDLEKRILGTKDILTIAYNHGPRRRVRLLIVVAQQARKRTHPPEQCYRGEGFERRSVGETAFAIDIAGRPTRVRVREVVFERSDEKRLVWYLYKSGDRLSTSYWGHQLGVALEKVVGRTPADTLIRFDTPFVGNDLDAARNVISDFATDALPAILNNLP